MFIFTTDDFEPYFDSYVNLIAQPNLVTDLVTKRRKYEEEESKLLKTKWWAIQDLNL